MLNTRKSLRRTGTGSKTSHPCTRQNRHDRVPDTGRAKFVQALTESRPSVFRSSGFAPPSPAIAPPSPRFWYELPLSSFTSVLISRTICMTRVLLPRESDPEPPRPLLQRSLLPLPLPLRPAAANQLRRAAAPCSRLRVTCTKSSATGGSTAALPPARCWAARCLARCLPVPGG